MPGSSVCLAGYQRPPSQSYLQPTSSIYTQTGGAEGRLRNVSKFIQMEHWPFSNLSIFRLLEFSKLLSFRTKNQGKIILNLGPEQHVSLVVSSFFPNIQIVHKPWTHRSPDHKATSSAFLMHRNPEVINFHLLKMTGLWIHTQKVTPKVHIMNCIDLYTTHHLGFENLSILD